jgi:DNA repair protein RecO (recombination protein O)
MSFLASRARVLRTYALGETSLIAVLLTEEAGLLRAVAKGARELKGRLRGLLEPGAGIDAQVYLKPQGGLHLLREATGRGARPRAAAGLAPLCLRLAALELVMATTEEGEPMAGLFALLEDFLALHEGESPPEPGWAAFFAFEAGLLGLHGLALDAGLLHCGQCGRALTAADTCFLPGEGLFACARHGGEGMALAPAERDWLLSIVLARPAALGEREPPEAVRARVERVLHLALSRHLPGYKAPRSLAVLGSARRAGADPKERP